MSKQKQRYSNHLTRYRERLGFTQEQLAHIVSCKNSRTIRRFESGRSMPGSLMMLRLAAALRVSVDYLYEETFKLLREEVRATEERMPQGEAGRAAITDMSGILDQMLQPEQFIPSSVNEYFALHLARRLDDDAAIRLYLHYVEHHPTNHLLNIYSKVKSHPEPAQAFHSALRPNEP